MILGIDLGQKTTGLAISEGNFASPYTTIKHYSINDAAQKVSQITNELNVDTIILGVVEGKIKSLFESFAQKFKAKNPRVNIIFWDETLTSRQAIQTMIKLNIPKIKRAQKQHEVAAAIILQSYIDNND